MKRYYSKTTGTTYLEGIHADIPMDAVTISEDLFRAIICNPPPDKLRAHDQHGLPVLIDPPAPTLEQSSNAERLWRNLQLQTSQWLVARHVEQQELNLAPTLTPSQFAELLRYRQALREWPESEGFPDDSLRPLTPSFVESESAAS
ncbi:MULTISPECIES: phage tail assembly chaperone [Pseudomonas]|uniref:phage tail assembly chaperone n=1 Tax=Pseudomonas TaxID=286 RepID=UPI00081915C1|nr:MULTISPECIES: phage tail assembly chaperone [Pseudomonas]MBK0060425.1 phage tail protein [Pseudomonas sp. S44]OCT28005.1 phage tail protein [Pseudomonas putida]OCT32503.1 phage tail protein [Pseudomonas putida]OCT36746.1 phage tail protein [Pseudomonas putida]OCT38625.1 phage tail protein [Pseudomonas putida]